MNQSLDWNFSHTSRLWIGCLVGAFVLAELLIVTTPVTAEILDKVRSAVRGTTSSSSSDSSSDDSSSSEDDSSDDDRDRDHDRQRDHHRPSRHHHHDESGSYLAIGTVYSESEDVYYESDLGYFPSFPYQDGWPGYMVLERPMQFISAEEDSSGSILADTSMMTRRRGAGRLSLEYGDDFNEVYRFGGNVLFSTTFGFGVQASLNSFGEHSSGASDRLFIGDVNFVYRFYESEHAQWRWGVGVNWLDDALGSEAGFNFTLGADFYPNDPFIVSGEIDWGWLGAAELFHGRVSLGVIRHGWEIFTGYDYYNIGGVEIDGPMLGLRVWF